MISSAVPAVHFQKGQNLLQGFLRPSNIMHVLMNSRHQRVWHPPLFHNAQLISERFGKGIYPSFGVTWESPFPQISFLPDSTEMRYLMVMRKSMVTSQRHASASRRSRIVSLRRGRMRRMRSDGYGRRKGGDGKKRIMRQ